MRIYHTPQDALQQPSTMRFASPNSPNKLAAAQAEGTRPVSAPNPTQPTN